jgi:hypothetical protein
MALFAALAFGADVTGTWTGPMAMTRDGETRDDNAHLVLTQTGKEIKGSAGPNEEKQMPITKGSIEGSDIVLEVTEPNGGPGKFTLRLKVDGDKMTGDLSSEGGEHVMTAKLTLTRSK